MGLAGRVARFLDHHAFDRLSGRPQLTWTVEIERANATQCTYWITVSNLTADPVKFEGRYNIL